MENGKRKIINEKLLRIFAVDLKFGDALDCNSAVE
jgi:hypothetical protein